MHRSRPLNFTLIYTTERARHSLMNFAFEKLPCDKVSITPRAKIVKRLERCPSAMHTCTVNPLWNTSSFARSARWKKKEHDAKRLSDQLLIGERARVRNRPLPSTHILIVLSLSLSLHGASHLLAAARMCVYVCECAHSVGTLLAHIPLRAEGRRSPMHLWLEREKERESTTSINILFKPPELSHARASILNAYARASRAFISIGEWTVRTLRGTTTTTTTLANLSSPGYAVRIYTCMRASLRCLTAIGIDRRVKKAKKLFVRDEVLNFCC